MLADATIDLINATVQIDQPISESKRMVGTGFLVSVPRGDGPPEIVLVTAAHVFDKMPNPEVRIGWRTKSAQGLWAYAPGILTIRSHDGPLWTTHPSQDIAVLSLNVNAATAATAIPLSMLADEVTFSSDKIEIGDEMMTLGYPHGLSANVQGFPILRSGKVASYPVGPSATYPTFLIDLTAVPGNSGGPVFMEDRKTGTDLVTGVLIKQVEDSNERLELGVVTDATYVRQTIAMNRKNRASAGKPSQGVIKTPGNGAADSGDLVKGQTAGQSARPSSQETKETRLPVPVTPTDDDSELMSRTDQAPQEGQTRPQ